MAEGQYTELKPQQVDSHVVTINRQQNTPFNYNTELAKLKKSYDILSDSHMMEITSLVNSFVNTLIQSTKGSNNIINEETALYLLDEYVNSKYGMSKAKNLILSTLFTYSLTTIFYLIDDKTDNIQDYRSLSLVPSIYYTLYSMYEFCCTPLKTVICSNQSSEIDKILKENPQLQNTLEKIICNIGNLCNTGYDNASTSFLFSYISLNLKKEKNNSISQHPEPPPPSEGTAAAASSSLYDNSQSGQPATAPLPPSHTPGFSR